ncbi:MAG: phospho-N-acetylmuramoyl-pentapeptide-transferase [Myxococcota bacterium]
MLHLANASSFLFNTPQGLCLRALMAALTSAGLCLLLGNWALGKLQHLHIQQTVRHDGPQTHLQKQGTPTMGGIVLLTCTFFACLLWANLSHASVWLLMGTCASFGLIGLYDDWGKIRNNNAYAGLSARNKLLLMLAAGCVVLSTHAIGLSGLPAQDHLTIPFVPANLFQLYLPFGLYWVFALLLLVGTANAVNLTDGLDGLAPGSILTSACTFGIFVYCFATRIMGNPLLEQSVATNMGELCIYCAAVAGACLGFLWFNTYPALIFMGDVGSLGLGACLGLLPILTQLELLSALIHGLFLAEALSVMLQVAFFKLTGGKRILRMAPLHHHLELSGWPEPRVVVRLWIVSILLSTLALSHLWLV